MLRKIEWMLDDAMNWMERWLAAPLACIWFIVVMFYFCKMLFEAGMRNP